MQTAGAGDLFADSRAIPGANRWYGGPAVELRALGPAAADGAVQGRWLAQVVATCAGLGWPTPEPRVLPQADGVRLAFRAPRAAPQTARAVNEWAWHQAQADTAADDRRAQFRAQAAAERSAPLERLLDAAEQRGLPWYLDDNTLSLGEGRSSLLWPRAALPWPADVPWQRLAALPRALLAGGEGREGVAAVATRLAAIARAAGFRPGTDRAALRDTGTDALVLALDAATLLHAGVPLAAAEVVVLTGLTAEDAAHHGLPTPEALAFVLLALAHAASRAPQGRGRLVMDGRCEPLLRVALHLPQAAACEWALFADEHEAPLLGALRRQGGATCGAHEGRLLLSLQGVLHDLGPAAPEPARWAEQAAAALAAACLGWPLEEIGAGLSASAAPPGR